MVWTAQDTRNKGDGEDTPTPSGAMVQALESAKVNVLQPESSEFVSQLQQAMKKSEKAYHVKAFRGSKDGKFSMTLLKSSA